MDDVSAVLDAPVADEVIDLQPEALDTQDPPELEEGSEAATPQEKEKMDGRRIDRETSLRLKALREAHPEDAQMLNNLRDEAARQRAFREFAPNGLEDAKAWKTTIDAMGGSEAAAEMMSRVAQYDEIDTRLASGDLGVLSDMPEEIQKGFEQGMPSYLSQMATDKPDMFNEWVKPHFQTALAATGLGTFLEQLYESLGDNPDAQAKVKQGYQWYQNQTAGAGKMPAAGPKTVDPETARLREQVGQHQQEKNKEFVNTILSTRDSQVSKDFDTHVAVYKKQFGLTDSQLSDLKETFAQKMNAKTTEGTPFFKQINAYAKLKSRDMGVINKYISDTMSADAKTTLDGIVSARYGTAKSRQTAAATPNAPTTSGGATRVAQTPDQSQWDHAKMEALGYAETAKKGIYWLKGGKSVQVVRQ